MADLHDPNRVVDLQRTPTVRNFLSVRKHAVPIVGSMELNIGATLLSETRTKYSNLYRRIAKHGVLAASITFDELTRFFLEPLTECRRLVNSNALVYASQMDKLNDTDKSIYPYVYDMLNAEKKL